ncbi:AAA family ATPase [Sutterella sp.]|uniref:AAA family ATPase n=1 Tax=Sutterella sp. TaxID=1981025 RepID=UPI003FD6EA52
MKNGALPLGTSSFAKLRESSQIYVDKTALIFQLASLTQNYFIARPRRFGKSLLISTIESLFRHGLRDFKGLKIASLWKRVRNLSSTASGFLHVDSGAYGGGMDAQSASDAAHCLWTSWNSLPIRQ